MIFSPETGNVMNFDDVEGGIGAAVEKSATHFIYESMSETSIFSQKCSDAGTIVHRAFASIVQRRMEQEKSEGKTEL